MELPEHRRPDEPRRHLFLWAIALILLFISVPFYYPEGRTPTLVWGLPDWCWVTLIADFLFAVLTAYLVLNTWKEPPLDEDSDHG